MILLPFHFDFCLPLVLPRFDDIFDIIVDLSNNVFVAQEIVADEGEDLRLVCRIQAQEGLLLDLVCQVVGLRVVHQLVVLFDLLRLQAAVLGIRFWWCHTVHSSHLSLEMKMFEHY